MKKFIIAIAATVLTVSAYAMSKPPADAKACPADKACAEKTAACADKKVCPACTETGGMCKACKAQVEAKKESCPDGVCPLTK